jgi:hypothetical protein
MNDQEQRRDRRRHKAGKDYDTADLGNGMEQATVEAVMHAIGTLPQDLTWEEMAPSIIPVLPRRRPMPPAGGEPFRVTLPPGISTGFGIDIGPAFLVVGQDLLGGWPVTPADLVARALTNLEDRLRPVRARDLFRQTIDGVPVRFLQTGLGCASALVLLPLDIERVFGRGPQLFIAPMRDLLVSMPPNTDRAFAGWLMDELASMDPNGLELDAIVSEGGALRYERLPGMGQQPAHWHP